MSSQMNPVWEEIYSSLPNQLSPSKSIPIIELLKTIEFCLESGVENYDVALQLLNYLSSLRNDISFLNWKAMIEYECKSYVKAFETSEAILEKNYNQNSLFNAGRAAYKANKLDKSELYLRKCIELEPTNSSAVLDYSVTVCTMGEFDKAYDIINSIDTSILDEKNKKIVEFNKGWHEIRKDNFKKGIDLIHLGREINIWGSDARKYDRPRWDGISHFNKTILIVGEGGIGDEVINARFAQIIKERGMNVVMSTVHNNISMLSTIKSIDKVISNKDIDTEQWDYWVPCMDLPYVLEIDSNEIPSDAYLSVDKSNVDKWKDKLQSNKKLKVGIRWMGNPRYELELARTIPVEMFNTLTDLDIQMYSLQKDDGIKNLSVPNGVIDISKELNSWEDTMSAMKNMDLIITSCTSVAHVAGALGVPTWIVTPLLPYYTWADMKRESYWYDSVSVYRQKIWKEWNHPFVEIKEDLIKLLEMK